jgi:hypothetical protein
LIYAPGLFDSYAGTGFPSIVDSAYQGKWKEMQFQIEYVSLFIDAAADQLAGRI